MHLFKNGLLPFNYYLLCSAESLRSQYSEKRRELFPS
jgi:hypothetical protein